MWLHQSACTKFKAKKFSPKGSGGNSVKFCTSKNFPLYSKQCMVNNENSYIMITEYHVVCLLIPTTYYYSALWTSLLLSTPQEHLQLTEHVRKKNNKQYCLQPKQKFFLPTSTTTQLWVGAILSSLESH